MDTPRKSNKNHHKVTPGNQRHHVHKHALDESFLFKNRRHTNSKSTAPARRLNSHKTHRQYTAPVGAWWENRRILTIVFSALLGLMVLMIVFMFTLKPSEKEVASYRYTKKFCDGVIVNGCDISGLSFEEAKARLKDSVEADKQLINISVIHDGSQWIFTAADLNVSSNIDAVLQEAICVGRGDTVVKSNQERRNAHKNNQEFSVTFVPDSAALAERVHSFAAMVNKNPVEPADRKSVV